MRAMIIIDHPFPLSYNHAILGAVQRGLAASGHDVDVLDLHADGFDPVMRRDELALYSSGGFLDPKVGNYQARIMAAQHLIFIFPVWWEVMPAMLKGWLDKVLLPEWAFGEADAAPKLTHISGATVITTMAAPEITYNSVERAFCQGTLGFCGISSYRWINYLGVSTVSQARREQWLHEIEAYARDLA